MKELKGREVDAIRQCEEGHVDVGIDMLSSIIAKYPEYASAYNNR